MNTNNTAPVQGALSPLAPIQQAPVAANGLTQEADLASGTANNVTVNPHETPATDTSLSIQQDAQEPTAGQAFSIEDYALAVPEHIAEEVYDPALFDRFKQFCAHTGLSPEQAQQAINFYAGEQAMALGQAEEMCESTLRSQWKEQFNQRLQAAQQACTRFDKRMQGRLMPLVQAGLGNNPVFGELMAEIGLALGEDSFPVAQAAAPDEGAMTTEEFLRKVVFKNK